MQKRQAINAAVSISRGKYVMWADAHCLFAKGFDEVLKSDCEENMVIIPRRYKLEPESWTTKNHLDGSLPVDYEYWIYRDYLAGFLKPYRWDQRAIERKDIMIDDTLTMQASCIFMHRTWFDIMGFMQVKGYTGWGQEDVEIAMKTWTNGGRVVVNKNTHYAHLYKGANFGRMYRPVVSQWAQTKEYGHRHWTKERKDDFLKVLKKFAPIPNWPEETWS
jgi:glycosyltransferase involved in cell wall biosynthesis